MAAASGSSIPAGHVALVFDKLLFKAFCPLGELRLESGIEGTQGEWFRIHALFLQDAAAVPAERKRNFSGLLPFSIKSAQRCHSKEPVISGGCDIPVPFSPGCHFLNGAAVAKMIAIGGRSSGSKVGFILIPDIDAAFAPIDFERAIGSDGKALVFQRNGTGGKDMCKGLLHGKAVAPGEFMPLSGSQGIPVSGGVMAQRRPDDSRRADLPRVQRPPAPEIEEKCF